MNGFQTTHMNPLNCQVWGAKIEPYQKFQLKPKKFLWTERRLVVTRQTRMKCFKTHWWGCVELHEHTSKLQRLWIMLQ